MNNLCEAIMHDIDSIDGSCVDAQFAVIEAAVALEEKVIEMTTLAHHNGFVQEGKFEDFLEKANEKLDHKPDEKLIKTILLAIPRLLLNLVNMIYNKWASMSFDNRVKRVEKELREWKRLSAELGDLEALGQQIGSAQPPQGVRFHESDRPGQPFIYITIYVSDIKKLRSAYDKMRDVCNDYADAIKNGIDKIPDDFVDMDSINSDIRSSLERNEIHESEPFITDTPEEYDQIVEFRQYHDTVVNEIRESMRKLEKWVSSHLQSGMNSKSNITKDTAKKLLADARKLYADFVKNDSLVLSAVDKTITTLYAAISWQNAQIQKVAELLKQRDEKAAEMNAKADEIEAKDKNLDTDAAFKRLGQMDAEQNKK